MFRTLTLPSSNPYFSSPHRNHLPLRPQAVSVHCRAAVQDFAEAASSSSSSSTSSKLRRPASLYEVLRVKSGASIAEIKAAYRNMAKLYHPDASPSATATATAATYGDCDASADGVDFIAIHNAYETLSDPAARALYDVSMGLGVVTVEGVRLTSASFSFNSAVGRPTSRFYPTRRWETDQCW